MHFGAAKALFSLKSLEHIPIKKHCFQKSLTKNQWQPVALWFLTKEMQVCTNFLNNIRTHIRRVKQKTLAFPKGGFRDEKKKLSTLKNLTVPSNSHLLNNHKCNATFRPMK